ncbi:alpha/beta hydrolase [Thermodesulfobacteriota bacterium]
MKIFLHGLESSSKGTKAVFLGDRYPEMKIPDFTGTLSERMKSLYAILAEQSDIILIGSSFGGLMAVIFAMEYPDAVKRIVLLAPALNFPEFGDYRIQQIDIPSWMFIGRDDSVTPAEDVVPKARKIFTNLCYTEVDDDHSLTGTFRTFNWKAMLSE